MVLAGIIPPLQRSEYAGSNDNVVELKNPGVASAVADALTEVLRAGARRLLAQAIETEVVEFLGQHRDKLDPGGRGRIVRNGYLPARTIQTGIGDVPVKVPRIRDRVGEIRFSSSILPPYLRRTKSIEELLPWLYLKASRRASSPRPWRRCWVGMQPGCRRLRSAGSKRCGLRSMNAGSGVT